MSSTSRLALAVIAALALGAGCTSTTAGTPAPTGAPPGAATSDPVAWIDNVCGALLPLADLDQPQVDENAGPAEALQSYSDYFDQAVTRSDEALAGLAAAGPSPVEGGDEAVAQLTDVLTTVRASFQDAGNAIDAADPDDPSSLATALPEALAPLAALEDLPNAATGLDNPELASAAEQAPRCQELEALEI